MNPYGRRGGEKTGRSRRKRKLNRVDHVRKQNHFTVKEEQNISLCVPYSGDAMVLSFKNRMQDKSNVSESQRCPGGSIAFCLLWSGTSSVERMGVNTCVALLLFCGWSWPRCVGRPNFNTCFIVAAVVLGITEMYMLVHSHKFVMFSGDSGW